MADLTAAGRELEARHGLVSIEGGRHPGWGTANRIVPLGDTYVELISVVDEAEAAQSAFGSWVAARATLGEPLGWAVRTREIEGTARRLGLEVSARSRATADGGVLRWRMAGIERAAAEPSLPFFLEWGSGTPFPGRAASSLQAAGFRISELGLEGDADRLDAWLGEHDLPVRVSPGTPALRRIVLTGPAGEIVLGA